jgi:catechol 2,3-dioxygenase-like lactoylglutathione lyase family enzyme
VETVSAPPWSIVGARHVGLTVSDLDRSLEFYCGLLGLELLWRRVYEKGEIGAIVGVPEATSFDIAMLRVPGGELELELLEYRGCEGRSGAAEPSDPSKPGAAHFALFVDDVERLHDDLRARGVRFRSDGPVEMTAGANRGGKSLYSHDPDGFVVEFHQRPSRAAERR